METVVGQLTYRRAVSKKLVFYDLLCPSQDQDAAKRWFEVVVKAGVYGSIEQVQQLRATLKLGDEVAVEGRLEGQHELQATAVTVQRAWQDAQPGVSFKPSPSPLHGSTHVAATGGVIAGSQQPQQQQQPPQPPQQQQPPQPPQQQQHPQQDAAGSAAGNAVAALLAQPPQPAVCKYWVNTGRCSKGAACPYAHDRTGALQQRWLRDRLGERQVLAASLGYSHSASAAAKGRRAQVFAAWLVERFGRDALNAGAGVLDVAGGAGGMTFELQHVHGVRCTLVDPRPLKLNKLQHRQLQRAGRAVVVHTTTAAQLERGEGAAAEEAEPAQQGNSAEEAVGGSVSNGSERVHRGDELSNCGASPAEEQQQQALPSSAGGGGADPGPSTAAAPAVELQQVQALFTRELWRSAGWRARFAGGFSLVLGLHPDQATEPILDYALEAGLPFAVVPCCVFPRLFPHRRLARPGATGGEVPVTTYPELVEYLAAKGRAQQAVLDLEGANTVVFRTGVSGIRADAGGAAVGGEAAGACNSAVMAESQCGEPILRPLHELLAELG